MRLRNDVADGARDRCTRPDRVVVAGNHEVDPLGIAVGVDQTDDRDSQPLGLLDGDRLGLEVDHEHRVGLALHVLDTAEVCAELREVSLRRHPLTSRQQLQLPLGLVALEVVQTLDAAGDRLEVGQQSTEPAVVDIRHAGRLGRVLDGVSRLLLGADEHHRAAATGDLRGEVLSLLQQRVGLLQINYVDAVALAEDEPPHLRIPTARLVAEMHAGLQQLSNAHLSHL